VPNHTSDEHSWFIKSVQRKEPYTNYYVWKDPIFDANGTRQPPNNWVGNDSPLKTKANTKNRVTVLNKWFFYKNFYHIK